MRGHGASIGSDVVAVSRVVVDEALNGQFAERADDGAAVDVVGMCETAAGQAVTGGRCPLAIWSPSTTVILTHLRGLIHLGPNHLHVVGDASAAGGGNGAQHPQAVRARGCVQVGVPRAAPVFDLGPQIVAGEVLYSNRKNATSTGTSRRTDRGV